MANIKSQKKRIITNEKSRMRNRAIKSELKTAVRRVREAVAKGEGAEAYASALAACRLLDKAAAKGVIHKNQAANRKSGVMALANTIVTDEIRAAYVKPAAGENKPGTKKADAKAAKAAAYEEANKAKAKRKADQEKAEKAAAKRKAEAEKKAAEEAAAAAAAEAEAAEEAADAE